MKTSTDLRRESTGSTRRVGLASAIGTTIEWYDFFIYADAAALTFTHAFFGPVSGSLGPIISFSTVGVSFVFRPLGAIIMGKIGDQYGRRVVLVTTLLLMGAATTLTGALPTYASIGIAAPILLVVLRILQGLSAGGEWGGAALIAVEHADRKRRGLMGSMPMLGVPVGLLIASGINSLLTSSLSTQQYSSWGWRVPFLLNIVLLVFGYYIRRRVTESPVFEQLRANAGNDRETGSITHLLRHYPGKVIKASVAFAGNNAAGYMLSGGYILGYATGSLGISQSLLLNTITVASVVWLVTTWLGGRLSDRFGRARVIAAGYVAYLIWLFPTFLLLQTRNTELIVLATVLFGAMLGITAGPLPALYSEEFPAHIRMSGASISYALGALIGGAFAPTIAAWLQASFHSPMAVSTYLVIIVALSLLATVLFKDRRGISLSSPVLPETSNQA